MESEMMTGKLTAEIARELLRYEPSTGLLFWRNRDVKWFRETAGRTAEHAAKLWNGAYAGKEALTAKTEGYKNGRVLYRKYHAHRIVWLIVHGEFPDGCIDHQNGDRSDNRIANLRCVNHQQNLRNMKRPKSNTSGICGVSWDKARKRWLAYITVDRRYKFIGHFIKKSDAAKARKLAEKTFGFHENHGRAK